MRALFLALFRETGRVFRVPSLRMAESQAAAGAPVYEYLFDWESPAVGGLLKSCHALEIPFASNRKDTMAATTTNGHDAQRRARPAAAEPVAGIVGQVHDVAVVVRERSVAVADELADLAAHVGADGELVIHPGVRREADRAAGREARRVVDAVLDAFHKHLQLATAEAACSQELVGILEFVVIGI